MSSIENGKGGGNVYAEKGGLENLAHYLLETYFDSSDTDEEGKRKDREKYRRVKRGIWLLYNSSVEEIKGASKKDQEIMQEAKSCCPMNWESKDFKKLFKALDIEDGHFDYRQEEVESETDEGVTDLGEFRRRQRVSGRS